MKGILGVTTILSVASLAFAEWTPDPDCPYPQTTVFRFQYRGDCSKYWECFGGSKYVQECPKGLEFNAEKMQCDTPELAHCDHSTATPPSKTTSATKEPQPTTWSPDPLCAYVSDESYFYNYPGDCSKYYECFRGNKYTRACPKGLYWNQEILECDYPANVHCNDSVTVRPTTPPAGQTTTSAGTTTRFAPDPLCPYPSTNVTYFRYPGDCNKYYECFAGHKFTRICPAGLWWNTVVNECDWPKNVKDCPSKPDCPASTPHTIYFPNPGDCSKYYSCYAGRLHELSCPTNLYWNQAKLSCDYKQNVIC